MKEFETREESANGKKMTSSQISAISHPTRCHRPGRRTWPTFNFDSKLYFLEMSITFPFLFQPTLSSIIHPCQLQLVKHHVSNIPHRIGEHKTRKVSFPWIDQCTKDVDERVEEKDLDMCLPFDPI